MDVVRVWCDEDVLELVKFYGIRAGRRVFQLAHGERVGDEGSGRRLAGRGHRKSRGHVESASCSYGVGRCLLPE